MDEYLIIISELELLIKHISSDLSAIALIDQNNRIRWRYMYGNQNDRYRHMVTKPGAGLAGQVFRFGRTVIIDQKHMHIDQVRDRLPIMLSEKLAAAIAVPIHLEHRIIGVLLVGDRQKRAYSTEDIEHVEQAKDKIWVSILQEYTW